MHGAWLDVNTWLGTHVGYGFRCPDCLVGRVWCGFGATHFGRRVPPTSAGGATHLGRFCTASLPRRSVGTRQNRWPALLAPGLLALLLTSHGLTGPAGAGCNRGAVNCMNNTAAMQRTCTATLKCTNAPSHDRWTVFSADSNNVTECNPTYHYILGATATFTLSAMAMTSSPSTRSCTWSWGTLIFFTFGTVSINTADGLPVELMGFSVEGEDEPAAAATEPEAETDSQ